MKRIDFLAWRPVSNASSRCRGAAYAGALARRGYELRFLPPAPDGLFRLLDGRRGATRIPAKLALALLVPLIRLVQIARSRGADAVILQRELYALGPPLLERLLAAANRRLVYDVDDAVDTAPPHLSRLGRGLRDPRRYEKTLRLCRHAIASTPYLAARLRASGLPVTVIPTPVDTRRFRPADAPSQRDVPALGWIGTGGNLFYLERIVPALAEVQRRSGSEVVVISEWDFRSPGLRVTNLRWKLREEPELMRRFDIGLMPLADNPYTRAKAGYKILQYWAAGLPAVASPVGFNRELIEPEVDGLLAEGHDDWIRQLLRLIEDGALRARLGAAGRAKVEARYSVEVCAELVAEILDHVTAGG